MAFRGCRTRGYQFERTVKAQYEGRGFFVARQGASLSPDLIAIPPLGGPAHFIECKSYVRPCGTEKKKLVELARMYGSIAIWAQPGRTLKDVDVIRL